ncbi:carboxymuconolactone decarboxylase family protein [Flagellimonas allohymeniacidonis]|uniref:Carboxymuconolactone decarboxylase family protein n=1 Tax=Flagellimonas allohymeniacidonis TaxID=2517819 RepID=A0A4Q8QED6_9FLAO|nr:hypothetical protein [Allomuricauda hymeniacidonis]TAI46863.1 hypothetical protein EW142_09175 [Allomuricauda hymeniacidonis]
MKQTSRGFKMDEASNEPQEVQEIFDWYKENFGFVPNLTKVMSAAPAALRSYWLTQMQLAQYGMLTPEEHNIIQMTVAVENRCKYCTSGHQMAGGAFFASEEGDLEAIRNEEIIPNEKFDALRSFTLDVYRGKGRVSDRVLKHFFSAGYDKARAIEVITNIGVKVMSNLTNQLAITEVDEPFAPLAKGLFDTEAVYR